MNKEAIKHGIFLFLYIVLIFTYIYIAYEYYIINKKHNLQNFLFIFIYIIFGGLSIYDFYKTKNK